MDGMERVSISTPFSVGQVNCYLFTENGLTVLDPGPATDEAYEELESTLGRISYSIDDIENVLITHPHIDHFGLVHQLVEQSGADVFAHKDAVGHLSDPIGFFEKERVYFRPFLLSMGMPGNTIDTILELPESYNNYQDPIEVDHKLGHNNVIDVGIELKCISTPGHAPGSLCYLAASEDTMFTGDHVLPNITPNPLLTLAPASYDERTRSLPTYLESLQKVLEIGVTVGYGGHGETIPTLQERVHKTIAHHQERKERIANLLMDYESTTAYQIMKEMFPELPATEMFSGMSEVIGHLDLLEDENRIVISEKDGVKQYELNTQYCK